MANDRYVIEDFEELPYEPEEDYWQQELPYDAELDFDSDPVTSYLPEEEDTWTEDEVEF